MSNVLHLNGLHYFQLPKDLFMNGRCHELTGAAFKLFAFICHMAQEKSSPAVALSALQLGEVVGLDKRTVAAARGVLEEANLVSSVRNGAGYVYTLLHPTSGQPLVKSRRNDFERIDFDNLTPAQLEKYFAHHLESGYAVKRGKLTASCPFHADGKPSLHISLQSHGAWLCHGCSREGKLIAFETEIARRTDEDITASQARRRILDVLVETGAIEGASGLPEAIYRYVDAKGNLAFEVIRFPNKRFRCRHPDPDNVKKSIWGQPHRLCLYGLPGLTDAEVVVVCEGEKDCDNMRTLNLIDAEWAREIAVTTNPFGANKWLDSYSSALKDKRVIIIPHNDYAGRKHARLVEASLAGKATAVQVISFPDNTNDATDFLEAHGEDAMAELLSTTGWIQNRVKI